MKNGINCPCLSLHFYLALASNKRHYTGKVWLRGSKYETRYIISSSFSFIACKEFTTGKDKFPGNCYLLGDHCNYIARTLEVSRYGYQKIAG